MNYKLLIAAALSASVLAQAAFAGGVEAAPVNNNGFYVGAEGGVAIPDSNFGELYSVGFGVGGHAGYRFDNLRVEGAYDYYRNSAKDEFLLPGQNAHIGLHTFMANVYYDFHNSTNFVPFVGVGLGLAHLTAENSVAGTTESGSLNAFGYQTTVGVDYFLTQNVSFGANYRFVGFAKDGARDYINTFNATVNYYFS